MMTINRYLAAFVFCSSFLAANSAVACSSDQMQTTDAGFIFKVVAGSDQILLYEDEGGTTELIVKDEGGEEKPYTMGLMQPYFVICENGDFYRVTDLSADTVDEAESGLVGFVPKAQVHPWPTREALSFSDIAFLEERTEIVAWDDEAVLNKFMETGNRTLHPPAFRENLEATRLRERSTRPYPVLASDERMLRKTAKKRVYEVLLPAAITPTDSIIVEKDDLELAQAALTSATILVVFDATASMDDFALETAKSISDGLSTLPKEVRENSQMGFLFYRDEKDAEKLVEVAPLPLAEAANALEKAAAFMEGGGDAAEPILDALYYASNIYPWGQAGKKIVIGVLNDDAKTETIGTLDDKGRVPSGLDSYSIAKDLYDKNIPVITVQAGPKAGPDLVTVLSSLGEETGGSFVKYERGATDRQIAERMTILLSERAADEIEKGKETLTRLEYDLNGYPTIPLEVLDGEMLERLREAGVDFNIDRGEGGVLVREGYILENADLLSPEIQIEKGTLLDLINLYSVLSTTGLDEESMRQAISEAIAAIAGEDYDAEDTIEEIVEKQLGIQFRSDLLAFDVNYIPAMVPNERLALAKRIQDAATVLNQYLEANLVEFDTQPAVWMPVSALP